MSDCIFCKIANKLLPTILLYEDDYVVAFEDINPIAETHILIIPREHISTALELDDSHEEVMIHLFKAVQNIVEQKGLDGCKLHMNVGREGGQTVMHMHLHLLAGETIRPLEDL